MRRQQLPHQREGLEEDVADVEDGEEPLVGCGCELEGGVEAGDLGVADVGAVEVGDEVWLGIAVSSGIRGRFGRVLEW